MMNITELGNGVVVTTWATTPDDFVLPDLSGLIPTPTLTKRQLRLGLLDLGVTVQQVSALIDQMPEPAQSRARIEWEDASTYQRSHPLVAQIATALSITEETLNAAWSAAAEL